MVSDEKESVFALLALAALKSKHGGNGVHPFLHFLFLLMFKEQTDAFSYGFYIIFKAIICLEPNSHRCPSNNKPLYSYFQMQTHHPSL